jgi:hypothetical protein
MWGLPKKPDRQRRGLLRRLWKTQASRAKIPVYA